ncbi:exonuclease domain-containing protein [Pedobacter flavus]|uniref:Exonuclease domain-containing protein n=1 Tax=Pedobacter flavus TaxID=3113906 RepID=A0ABU7H2V7_9SPHI|nr:exonuclease domain-containing protein [Pedobacter sp. VNH31]MEE1885584.1 exonuclease domain-containing protein [Pedobacter sp. VNH31]
MHFAIVDIETTGGHPSINRITEISIIIHNGEKVVEKFSSLINPLKPIPIYITALTGINDEMVVNAPKFHEIAPKIISLLEGKIFVAHNVNFDYSFLKHQLNEIDYVLNLKKLCTVRLSRKLIPQLPSYSLGKLCNSLNIEIHNRHRAEGDATATTILFEHLLKLDVDNHITQMIKKGSKEQQLPPHIEKEQFLNLPTLPGVYYFKDNKGKVIYVGKAVNIQKRVLTHFSGHNPSKQRQDFIKKVHYIESTSCGTELMALITEATEIKRLWPENNKALKKYEATYGLYEYVDQKGYLRLGIDKKNKNIQPFISFNNLLNALNFLNNWVETHDLCPRLSGIYKFSYNCEQNRPNCNCLKSHDEYNQLVEKAIDHLNLEKPQFMLIDKGRSAVEKSCILVENGKFYGMGYLQEDQISNIQELKDVLTPYPSNSYILSLILNHAEKYPYKVKPIY